jgi:hypothetical protein
MNSSLKYIKRLHGVSSKLVAAGVFLILITCSWVGKTNNENHITTSRNQRYDDTITKVSLQKIEMRFVVGNFDGKDLSDTIFLHYYSHTYKTEIYEIPTSSDNDWEDIIDWFHKLYEVEVYLTYRQDTLFLGAAYGLYCLLNIGDVNSDGKDEIAFVVNWLDYSNINSCKIYSMCNARWELLMEFTIHESAFELPNSETVDTLAGIKGYLEKADGSWMYNEYDVSQENINAMKILYLNKCIGDLENAILLKNLR